MYVLLYTVRVSVCVCVIRPFATKVIDPTLCTVMPTVLVRPMNERTHTLSNSNTCNNIRVGEEAEVLSLAGRQ